jgi:hypothetical protein
MDHNVRAGSFHVFLSGDKGREEHKDAEQAEQHPRSHAGKGKSGSRKMPDSNTKVLLAPSLDVSDCAGKTPGKILQGYSQSLTKCVQFNQIQAPFAAFNFADK